MLGRMAADEGFTADQTASATTALRAELGLPAQRFPTETFVGMISDEIEAMRAAGKTDGDIATVLRERCAIDIDAATLARYYASPNDRRPPQIE